MNKELIKLRIIKIAQLANKDLPKDVVNKAIDDYASELVKLFTITERQRLIAEIDFIKTIENKAALVVLTTQFDTWQTILEQKEKRLAELNKNNL